MQPVFQTTGKNCLAACIASLMEVPIDYIPQGYLKMDIGSWVNKLNKDMLELYGIYFLPLGLAETKFYLRGYSIAIVNSESVNEGEPHAVVIDENLNVIHDPMEGNEDVEYKYVYFDYILVPIMKDIKLTELRVLGMEVK